MPENYKFFEEDHFIFNFNQTIFWLRIADIIPPISKGECQVDTVIAIIEQISTQLMQLAVTLADADVTTKILVALCAILIIFLLVMIAKPLWEAVKLRQPLLPSFPWN